MNLTRSLISEAQMRKWKVALTTVGLLALVACGSDKKNARQDNPKDDPTGVTNTNNGAQGEELPAPTSTSASYQSQDGLYSARLDRNGERYSISLTSNKAGKGTYIQNMALSTSDKKTYSLTTPGYNTPILDEVTLTKLADNICRIVWKEYGYKTYDRIFQGQCP